MTTLTTTTNIPLPTIVSNNTFNATKQPLTNTPYSVINNNTDTSIIRLSKLEDKIYFGINIFCTLYFIIPLIWIYFYRNSYIIIQRSFILTLIGGVSSFLSAKTNLASQNYNVSCAFTYYSRVVFMFISQVCFVSRAFRLILLYKKFVYLIMPFLILGDFLMGFYFKQRFNKKNICNWKGNYNLNDKILLYSQFSSSSKIPESYKTIFETQILHEFLCTNKAKDMIVKKIDPIYTINSLTKNGIILFVFVDFFIQLTSVIIPLIKCIQEEKSNKKNQNTRVNTIEYFYKILESPIFMEELKNIAVQEFVVQDILFWENYCTLHKITARSIIKFEERNSIYSNNNNYNYNDNHHHHHYSHRNSSHSSIESGHIYIPYYPILPELLPYYYAFCHIFIDRNGPCTVNISENCRRSIYHTLNNNPVVSVFDEAKDEIVESMYVNLFPILLQNSRKQINNN
ncbi:hypothetical protein BCR32DRAFT_248011 [Anaeromyces robustus]|uniref:RGS domain-containing protein n=1 Tax=Anaeromyces robustus TaxID=1754192 RepID=A0A1Y1WVB0_9FUNG|nr:hypothetical protein BCR32DRAFT_248011 [Anaeromyces robustus]|eukprot:ORX77345.1 hypothetical protein BCR32DRAFT_248011 [Anaeromyces robustus]